MRKTILILITMVCFTVVAFSQVRAKKPTIMVVPSDVWCNQNGFMKTFDNQGSIQKEPDYERALQSDPTLLQVISQINGMMAERGFPLKDLESTIKKLKKRAADRNIRMSSKTGGGVQMSGTDELKMQAKADIWMQVTYTVNNVGPKKSIQFNLRGLDAHTDKQVATAVGNGEPSFSASIPELMEEAVLAHLDNFNSTLQDYFDDLFDRGREVILEVQCWDDWGDDLETEDYGDDELMVVIENWIEENTKGHSYTLTDQTENYLLFEQVRIPILIPYKDRMKAYDASAFAKDLRKYLKTLGLECKSEATGLGSAILFVGHK